MKCNDLYRVTGTAAIAAASLCAQAQTARWTNANGGDFATPGNWDVGQPPAPSDTAAFGPAGAYTVTLSANTTVTNLVVDTGSPTFDMQGFSLHLGVGTGPGTATFAPAGTGTISVTLRNGSLSLPPLNANVYVGGPAGSVTNLDIGPNAGISGPYGTVHIGGAGVAHVTLNGTIYFASGAYPDGSVIVNAGSTFLMTAGSLSPNHLRNFGGQFTMAGGSGNITSTVNTGDFTLSGGAHLVSGYSQSSGDLTITGGATLTSNNGNDVTGADVVLDGGTFTGSTGPQGSPNSFVLRNSATLDCVFGGTTLSGSPLFSVGPGSTVNTSLSMQGGVLHVDQGANMNLQTLTLAAPTTLEVAINGASLPSAPMINCMPFSTVGASLAGALTVVLNHPNNLHIGDQVEVIRVASGHTIQGAFSNLAAPMIGGSRQFQIVQTAQSVFLRIVAGGSPCWTADFDGDGDVATDADIEAFFACIAGNCCPTCASADFNGDGDTATDADIESFFRVLAGAPC